MDELLTFWSTLLNELSTLFKYFEPIDVLAAFMAAALAGIVIVVKGYGVILVVFFSVAIFALVLLIATIGRRWAWRRRSKKGIASESLKNQMKGWP